MGDYNQLAQKIIYMIENPEVVKVMSLAAKGNVLTKFDKQKMVSNILKQYERLIEKAPLH